MQVYFDHNASSPMHPEVLEAMLPYLTTPAVNASSLHRRGRMAKSAIETAREQIAEMVNSETRSVIFTSGGSEANNLAVKGFVDYEQKRPLVSSGIEHPSIIEPINQLRQQGCDVIQLDVDRDGRVNLDAASVILSRCSPQLLSVMSANNETGVIQPIQSLCKLLDPATCFIHTDATQVIGKLPVDMKQLGVHALSFSGHKLQGPQGIGALVSSKKPERALISGGSQENNRRAGTESVALIVGLGKAAQLCQLEMERKRHYLTHLRDEFEKGLMLIPGVEIFGKMAQRLPNTTYFSLPYYHGETLLMELDRAGFALSSGSACHSEVTRPSHVLMAMGINENLALNAIRVSLDASNTMQEIESLLAKLNELVNKLPAVFRQVAV